MNVTETTSFAQSLRKSVRLIHCLQKERGASCLYCATSLGSSSSVISETTSSISTGVSNNDQEDIIYSALHSATRDADTAIALLLMNDHHHHHHHGEDIQNITRNLQHLRQLHDTTTPLSATSSPTAREQFKQNRKRTSSGGVSMLFEDMKRWSIFGNDEINKTNNADAPSAMTTITDTTTNTDPSSLVITTAATTTKNEASPQKKTATTTVSNHGEYHVEEEEIFISSLLSILLLFVRLKESTGIERA
eukprot:6808244-Ditylum_brightwellii.AAC.1